MPFQVQPQHEHDSTSEPARGHGPRVLIELATSRVAVAAFSETSPTDSEWKTYVETLAKLGRGGHRTLVLSIGGGPTARQREELAELAETQEDVKIAVVTNSVFARGIVTALRWFRRDANLAFEPNQLGAALDYLELDDNERERVCEVAKQLIASLGLERMFSLLC